MTDRARMEEILRLNGFGRRSIGTEVTPTDFDNLCDALRDYAAECEAAEREACAKIADDTDLAHGTARECSAALDTAAQIAEFIRERSRSAEASAPQPMAETDDNAPCKCGHSAVAHGFKLSHQYQKACAVCACGLYDPGHAEPSQPDTGTKDCLDTPVTVRMLSDVLRERFGHRADGADMIWLANAIEAYALKGKNDDR